MLDEYCNNRFCQSIAPEERKRLCAICRRETFRCGQAVPPSKVENNVMIVLDGAFATVKAADGKMQYLHTACDIFAHEYLFNDKHIKYSDFGTLQIVRPLAVAFFQRYRLRELFMECPTIARALFMNLSVLDNRKSFFRMMVQLEDAYHAVIYMLLLLEKRGFEPPPTQSELAFFTGLNRVTVSRCLTRLFREEQYDSLRQYMESVLVEPRD